MSKDNITIQSPITEEKILGSPITEEKVLSSGITTHLVIQSPIGIESIVVSYSNEVVTNAFFGETAVFDFDVIANFSGPVVFIVDWGAQVGTTEINTTLVSGVSKSLQTEILIPLGVDASQTIQVTDSLGGSDSVPYTVEVAIPTLGLMGQWLMNNTPNDSSGNGHNGTLKGTTTPQPTTNRQGAANSAYEFNGTTAYIALEGTFPDIGSIDFSVSAWFFSGNLTNQGHIISFKEDFAAKGFAITQDTSATNHIDIRLNAVQFQLNLATVLDTWYHIVVTADRDGNLSAFIDSIFDSSVDISSAGTFLLTKDPAFGVRNDFPNVAFFDGKIDDVRIYNRILSQTEIDNLFAE